LCMPFIPGQEIGLITGISMVIFYSIIYLAMRYISKSPVLLKRRRIQNKNLQTVYGTEFSEELAGKIDEGDKK
jgi:hypothetical protein